MQSPTRFRSRPDGGVRRRTAVRGRVVDLAIAAAFAVVAAYVALVVPGPIAALVVGLPAAVVFALVVPCLALSALADTGRRRPIAGTGAFVGTSLVGVAFVVAGTPAVLAAAGGAVLALAGRSFSAAF